MRFRTEYEPKKRKFELNPSKGILLLGSCFTDYVGERMVRGEWKDVMVNPCGTLFNPLSIARTLSLALGEGELNLEEVEEGKWIPWDFPTRFAVGNRGEIISRCREALGKVREGIASAEAIVLTFGTARVYFHDGMAVANCHKLPSSLFQRNMVTEQELSAALDKALALLPAEMKIILTVSPVRHVKDGFEANSLSKAILRQMCHTFTERYPERVEYFPSYEIVTDDLRDYRFYGADMIHPSDIAVDYIWDIFCKEFLSPSSITSLIDGERRWRRSQHRPLLPSSEAVSPLTP